MKRPTIALCVIVKNEAHNLPRLLKSVEGCFDEICITDTGSTDETVKIAEEAGCKVSHFNWVYDFSAARNFNFEQAESDFICWLDADDELDSKEKFILWRDTCLGLDDYVLARYDYAHDSAGSPTCQFLRERVVRNHSGFKWSYFIHEGIKPYSTRPQVRTGHAPWVVKHRRSQKDIEVDKSRNLKIFEHHKDGIDARMTYYWGKELFENGKQFDACMKFQEALKMPELELHDRILAMQYIGYCYIHLNQFDRAIDISLTGLQLSPNRAEFFTNIGDSYLKKGQIVNCIPFFEAASNCQVQQQGVESTIFSNHDLYTKYPRNQLARAWFHLGNLDKAIEIAKDTQDKWANTETEALLAEFQRQKIAMTAYTYAKPCEDIVISTPPQNVYEWDPEKAKKRSMGGSETAAIEMAYWLKKHSGRPVKVFNMRKEDGTFDGVEYISNQKIHDYFKDHKPYFHIAWRHNLKVTDAPTFLWCHDLFTPGAENIENYVKHLCLTPFHKRYTMTKMGIPEDKILVTRNGLNVEKFEGLDLSKKDPFKFVFSSSPDRGLDRTIRVLTKVKEKFPEVTLHIYYGWEHFKGTQLEPLMNELIQMTEERDWVHYHGATEQRELMKAFAEASYCVQPSDWIETSKISALEQAFCGVYQITRAVGGVVNTLKPFVDEGTAELIYSDCITDEEHEVYVDAVCRALEEKKGERRTGLDIQNYSWESVAKEWLEQFPELLK